MPHIPEPQDKFHFKGFGVEMSAVGRFAIGAGVLVLFALLTAVAAGWL